MRRYIPQDIHTERRTIIENRAEIRTGNHTEIHTQRESGIHTSRKIYRTPYRYTHIPKRKDTYKSTHAEKRTERQAHTVASVQAYTQKCPKTSNHAEIHTVPVRERARDVHMYRNPYAHTHEGDLQNNSTERRIERNAHTLPSIHTDTDTQGHT